ncbi:MAG: ABC transporter ATP-binding protein [Steroidobacteraceae bacterium]
MIIQTENLTKKFWRHEAVLGANLTVTEGAICALVGANGAGKTTLMRVLVDILGPDEGSARVLGVDSRRLTPHDRLRIGYLAESQKLPDRLSVAQYFDYLRSLYPTWDRSLEARLREQFQLPSMRSLCKLSHGTRMKVMLIGVLAFMPKLLILDEPLSGLDPLVRDEVMAGLLAQAGDTTIFISSHELSEIEGCTTHVAFMVRGNVIMQESMESLAARCRDVTVTLVQQPVVSGLPESWLNPQAEGLQLHFVDTAFVDSVQLREQVQKRLGGIHHFESTPLSLRDISKALIRATRQES